MVNCGIYCRVSTEMQKDNYSVEIQKKRGISFAETNGYDYTIYSDVESGSSINRPSFKKLITDIQADKIQVIHVVEFSRLSRNDEEDALFIRQLFVEKKIQLFENGFPILFDSPEDKLFYSIRSSVAAYERRKIVERMQNGIIQKYSKGERKHPNVFGYDHIDGVIHINPDEKETVVEVFTRISKGESYNSIASDLMVRGKKRKNGKTNWTTGVLSKIVRQLVYTGQIKAPNGDIINSTHYTQIISDELWEKTKSQLRDKVIYRDKLKVRRGQFELSGLLRCSHCKTKYFRKSNYHPKTKIERGFYIHVANTPERLQCKNNLIQTSIDERKLNYIVRAMYLENFSDYESIKIFYEDEINKINSENTNITAKLEEMNKQKVKLTNDKSKLIDAILEGVFTNEDVKNKRIEIDDAILQIDKKINELSKALNQSNQYYETLDNFSEKELMEFWDLTGQERKDLYCKRIESINIYNRSLKVIFINKNIYEIDDIYNLDEEWTNKVSTISSYYE